MNADTYVTIPDRSLARQYTEELAARLVDGLHLDHPPTNDWVTLMLSIAFDQIQRDITAGRVVVLEHIGEFIKVAFKDGPGIRYQADRNLLLSCCIENLKSPGGNRHGTH